MDYLKSNVLPVIIVIYLAYQAIFGGVQAPANTLGALDRTTVSNPWTFAGSVTVNNSAHNLTVTTSNTATSTLVAGCWQFYATSTATALKYMASTTPGIMYSQYGSCP